MTENCKLRPTIPYQLVQPNDPGLTPGAPSAQGTPPISKQSVRNITGALQRPYAKASYPAQTWGARILNAEVEGERESFVQSN